MLQAIPSTAAWAMRRAADHLSGHLDQTANRSQTRVVSSYLAIDSDHEPDLRDIHMKLIADARSCLVLPRREGGRVAFYQVHTREALDRTGYDREIAAPEPDPNLCQRLDDASQITDILIPGIHATNGSTHSRNRGFDWLLRTQPHLREAQLIGIGPTECNFLPERDRSTLHAQVWFEGVRTIARPTHSYFKELDFGGNP